MAKTFQDLLNEGQAKVLGIVSIVPMDDWNADTQYQKLNLVRHNGATYLAKGASKNVEPGVTQDWQSSWMLVYLDGVSPDGIYPELTAGRVMHALAWGNKNYDGSSAQTITAADLGLADVYKPQGSIAYSALPATPSSDNYGYVWNITNDFTTDSRFIEGAGKSYSAGTNVGVIEQDGAYYYDIFGAFVDLSNYATVEALNAEITRAKAAEQANASAAQNAQSTANSKYTKPSSGIPKSDLAQSVQDSLDKADSALQSAPVTSVNGETGAVTLAASDVGAATSAQGAKADQAATDIASIKDGTTVVGQAKRLSNTTAVGSSSKPVYFSANGVPVACGDELDVSVTGGAGGVTAITVPSDAALNNYRGGLYWGKTFVATSNNNIQDLPEGYGHLGFNLVVLKSGGAGTVQILSSVYDSDNSNAPTIYIRSFFPDWSAWEEIVTSDGSYPTLGAGYFAKQLKINTPSAYSGYVKIGTVPFSAINTWQCYNCVMLISGIFRGSDPSTGTPMPTGQIEIETRKYSAGFSTGDTKVGILFGDMNGVGC